jgi:hypothetical protein
VGFGEVTACVSESTASSLGDAASNEQAASDELGSMSQVFHFPLARVIAVMRGARKSDPSARRVGVRGFTRFAKGSQRRASLKPYRSGSGEGQQIGQSMLEHVAHAGLDERELLGNQLRVGHPPTFR